MNRTEMRRCGKRYASKDEAARSKRAIGQGATPGKCVDPECGGWHLTKASAPRAVPGSMQAAVALVLTGERTVAQAALECDVAAQRLEARAGAEFRRVCLERDHYTCLHCGALATEVQHRVARGSGGTSDPLVAFGPANGASLCSASHRLAETRDEGMHALGFWLRRDENPAEVPVYVCTEYGYEFRWLLPDGECSLTDPNEVAA